MFSVGCHRPTTTFLAYPDLGRAVNGALAELTTCLPKDLYYEASKLPHTLMHIHEVLGPQANYMLKGFYMSD